MNENLYQIVLLESSRRRFLFDELLLLRVRPKTFDDSREMQHVPGRQAN